MKTRKSREDNAKDAEKKKENKKMDGNSVRTKRMGMNELN